MFQFMHKGIITILICIFILASTYGCKDDYNSQVPYVYVDMNFPSSNYIELDIPGGAIYIKNAGFGGIIIVNNFGDSTNPLLAFDATCTFEVSSTARVEVKDMGSGIATCPKCGSQFMIFGSNGSPIKGPAIEPLKQYQALNTNGRIIVRN